MRELSDSRGTRIGSRGVRSSHRALVTLGCTRNVSQGATTMAWRMPFPPSRMPASVEFSIKLVVCLSASPRRDIFSTKFSLKRDSAGEKCVYSSIQSTRLHRISTHKHVTVHDPFRLWNLDPTLYAYHIFRWPPSILPQTTPISAVQKHLLSCAFCWGEMCLFCHMKSVG